jgi:putative SOS response-associated peptidase YedK
MCVNYETVSREILYDLFDAQINSDDVWHDELYRDYLGPIIIHNDAGERQGLAGNYSMVPKRHMRPGETFSTMNARAETIGQLRNYKPYWTAGNLCLVPMHSFYEPNWEGPEHVRWKIGMADESPFAVAGIYRQWQEHDGGTSWAFTQITINADDHPLMKRFHKKKDEKRSLVIVPPSEYDDWLSCKNPEQARGYLQLFPADLMAAAPAPKPKKLNVAAPVEPESPSLF